MTRETLIETDWKTTMHVADWQPRRGFGWKGPRLINDHGRRRFQFFSEHQPWSITWRRFMEIEPQSHRYTKRVWFKFDRHAWNNGGGQMYLAMLRWFVISYHWQRHMRWPEAPICTICNQRIGGDYHQGSCGSVRIKQGCAMPDPEDKRAVYARWKKERPAAPPSLRLQRIDP